MAERLASKIPGAETGIEIRNSVCAICDPQTQCGLDLYIHEGRIVKVEGTKENPYNQGTLCAKGAALRQYVYNEDRIKTPLRRTGPRGSGEFKPISWDEALDEIASTFNRIKAETGPEAVAFFAGYTKYFRPYLHRLTHLFGSPNYMTESSTCSVATQMAQKLVYGQPAPPDMKNTRCVLIWSSNPAYSNPSNARGLFQSKGRGVKLICVDPRVTPTAMHADIHLQLRPGTDGALALAMANVIIAEGLYDREFVANYTYGFDEYREYCRQFTPEAGEQLTGVPAAKIREAARMYATTAPAAILPSACAVVHHTNGVQNYRAVFSLAGLTGNFDVPGGNLTTPPGVLEMFGGFVTRERDFGQPKKWEEMAPRVGAERFPVWMELVDQAQAMDLPRQINTGQPYPIRGLIGFGMNYRMWPDSEGLLKSLEKLDLFVNIDPFLTDSCRHADIVLPCCTSVERSELRNYRQNYVLFTTPAIKPLYESRSDVDIICALAEKLGVADPLLKGGLETSVDWMLEPSGLKSAELKLHTAGMKVPKPVMPESRKYLKGGFKTPSGKLEFKSTVLARYDREGYEALPVYRPSRQSVAATPELAKEYPLVLDTGARLPMYVHTRMFRVPWVRSLRPEAAADLNPEDAAKLGIQQNDAIRLVTPKGAIAVRANLTQMVMPGVVHMYHGYPQANVNQIIDGEYLDPISGFPGFKSLLCRVEKAGARGGM
jgi:anaerobic selenocysteine-containing dehydrogenase